ncbi:MAG: hypothetical protein HY689_13545 [Chloroflexi bacterium]|nr:hypothetical protein [Chloroflexota bacterium]
MLPRSAFSVFLAGVVGLALLLAWSPLGGRVPGSLAAPQAGAVTIAMDPGSASLEVGQMVALDIRVNAGTQQVDAVDVFLDFDPAVLRVVDAAGNEAGAVTPASNSPLKQTLANRADNALGRIDFSAGRSPADAPGSGSFVVATVRFHGRAPGSSAVAFSLTSARPTGVFFQSVALLGSVTDGSVTVTATATPTPTPTTPPPPSGGGGGGGGGGESAATPTATPPRTPTATATVVAAAPALAGPADGATATDMAAVLQWANPPGRTQYQVQVLPAPTPLTGQPDGPAIDLIIGDQTLVQQARFQVQAPRMGVGNYVLLPGMSYTWRVRTTTASAALGAEDPRWGPWQSRTFRVPLPSSATLAPVAPAEGSAVASLTPTLQWANSDPRIFYYEVQVSKDSTFTTDPARATAMVYWELRHGGVTTPSNSYTIPVAFPLEPGTAYYWRVRPRVQGDGAPVAWSATWSFRSP